jgi:spore coat polysaccharide biosynthesis protein SpsF
VRVLAVVQARAGSSRLPAKVLRPLGGRPVLTWVVRAAQAARGVDAVVVATSTQAADDAVAALAQELDVGVFRGSQDDVLDRFRRCADAHGADAVVRLTADCPLLDPELVAQVVGAWRTDPSLDYVATTLVRSWPRGLDVELVTRRALHRLDELAAGHHRSHVTSLVHERLEDFRVLGLVTAPPAADLRVTLDVAEDAALLDALVPLLPRVPPRADEVVRLLRERPELRALNAAVQQKALEEG